MMKFSDYLLEQAMNIADAESRITAISHELEVHILKLLMCPNNRNYNHWLSEVDSWLRTYNKIRLKNTNKMPTSDQVNNWARKEWLTENVYKNDSDSIKDEYKDAKDITYTKFNKVYEKILNLSVSNNYSKNELKQILDQA